MIPEGKKFRLFCGGVWCIDRTGAAHMYRGRDFVGPDSTEFRGFRVVRLTIQLT